MKKSYILFALTLSSLGFFAFKQATSEVSKVQKFSKEHSLINSKQNSGGQSGLTGAPGEQNCTQCHIGTTQNGTTQNVVSFLSGTTPITTYIPGSTYTVTLQLASNPAKAGFSTTSLDGTNAKAGSLIGAGIGGTQNFSASGRDYISHTSASNTFSLWAWSWVAPATNVGPVTFYIASNETNNNNANTGDMIFLSQHVINSNSGVGIEENTLNDGNFTAGFNSTTNKLAINFDYLGVGEMKLNVVDMNGRSVFTYDLGHSIFGSNKETITLPVSINDGMYVVHFFVGNKAMSANILVKK